MWSGVGLRAVQQVFRALEDKGRAKVRHESRARGLPYVHRMTAAQWLSRYTLTADSVIVALEDEIGTRDGILWVDVGWLRGHVIP